MNDPIKTTLYSLVMVALIHVAPQLRAAPQEADTDASENDVAPSRQVWANDVANPAYDPTTAGELYLLGPRYIVSEDESRATFDWLYETMQARVSGMLWLTAVDYAVSADGTDVAQAQGSAVLQEIRVFEAELEAVEILDPVTDPIPQRLGMRLDRTMVSAGTFDPRDNSVEFELWLTGDEGPLGIPMPVQVRGRMHAGRLILTGDTGAAPDYTRLRFSISASAAEFEQQDSAAAFVQGAAQRAGALGGMGSAAGIILTGSVNEPAANETDGEPEAARRTPSYEGRKPSLKKQDRDG